MAHTKATGSTKLGRDSASKRLGVKLYSGERARAGSVIVRQRGTKFYAGKNVRKGSDDTLYSTTPGTVKFRYRPKKSFTGKRRLIKLVDVLPEK
jgi:large subunit ribosomal protein L27